MLDDSDNLEAQWMALARYRAARATELVVVSGELLESGHFKDSVNRSYFAIFNALRAALALEGFDSRKHSGVIGEFRKSYIKTGAFDPVFSEYIGSAFSVRNDSDYDDFFIVSKEDALTQLGNARELVSAVSEWLMAQAPGADRQQTVRDEAAAPLEQWASLGFCLDLRGFVPLPKLLPNLAPA
jgi:uncharacterized protein (UPF0332 family)